jgi:hypothetical protein
MKPPASDGLVRSSSGFRSSLGPLAHQGQHARRNASAALVLAQVCCDHSKHISQKEDSSMRLLTTTAALALAATLPAAAQQSGTQQPGSQAQKQDTQQQGAQQSGKPDVSAMSQQKLRQSLQQAGFKDINIVDAAYVVHAKTQDGNFVVMYIDPPSSMTGGRNTTGSGASGSGGASTDQNKR